MIRGTVSGQPEARIRLQLRGPGGVVVGVTAVIDTGFTGQLTLPAQVVAALGLNSPSAMTMVQADGSAVRFDAYLVEVEWNGVWVSAVAAAVSGKPLVGMKLLLGHELRVAVVPGGAVEISPLP